MIPSHLTQARSFLLLFFISLLLALVDTTPALSMPKAGIQIISSPIQYGLYKSYQAVANQFEFILLARTAAKEHKALEEQMAEVISENANLRRQLAEAKGFQVTQQSLDPKTYTQVAARPISLIRYLKIDKGSEDGLKVGMPVVYKDTYLGQIKDLGEKSSDVLLSSDPDSKIEVFIQSDTGRAKGVLTGQFGSDMLLDKILHEEPVKVGDLVYSEGVEGNLPRGLVLGRVSDVLNQPNQIFKQAKVKPVFEAGDLDIVFVITN